MRTLIDALAWPTRALSGWLHDHVPALRKLNDWADRKEREWNRRRNRGLVTALRDAGLHSQADRLEQ